MALQQPFCNVKKQAMFLLLYFTVIVIHILLRYFKYSTYSGKVGFS